MRTTFLFLVAMALTAAVSVTGFRLYHATQPLNIKAQGTIVEAGECSFRAVLIEHAVWASKENWFLTVSCASPARTFRPSLSILRLDGGPEGFRVSNDGEQYIIEACFNDDPLIGEDPGFDIVDRRLRDFFTANGISASSYDLRTCDRDMRQALSKGRMS